MKIETHTINNRNIAEVIGDDLIIETIEDGVDLLGNIYYQGYSSIILNKKNITTVFFDLSNGMAGEILQKFSTYRIRLAIVGDFSEFNSKSLNDFIYESNKIKHINFLGSTSDAIYVLSQE